ncbi:hypothetical protein ACJIZ3_023635 [Penstemon smallii]|uniref:Uncharacterized protein n=1 Tax=Penstemon smallii TaxID=265156 RepID=A0ABD3TPL2_9LAMI
MRGQLQLLPISKLCASNFPFLRSSPSRIFTLQNAIDSLLFKQWLKNIQTETRFLASGSMSLKEVLIQGVDMFGSRVGFLKFKANVIDKETGKKVPGIVFARGPAVAVLILLNSDGETYAVLTEQVRVPIGKLILELPSGMLDDDKGDIAGTAIRPLSLSLTHTHYDFLQNNFFEEETGLHLNCWDFVFGIMHPRVGIMHPGSELCIPWSELCIQGRNSGSSIQHELLKQGIQSTPHQYFPTSRA